MIKITQGESYPIFINIKQDGVQLTPDMIQDLKICVGNLHYTYLGGGVMYDASRLSWYINPTQQETLSLDKGKNEICAHVKYQDGTVIIDDLGILAVAQGCGCGEVF